MRPQQGRQGGAEIAAKPFVQGLQGPHLLLAHAFRPLEVVRRDLLAVLGAAAGGVSRRPASAAGAAASPWAAMAAEQVLHFRLA